VYLYLATRPADLDDLQTWLTIADRDLSAPASRVVLFGPAAAETGYAVANAELTWTSKAPLVVPLDRPGDPATVIPGAGRPTIVTRNADGTVTVTAGRACPGGHQVAWAGCGGDLAPGAAAGRRMGP